jgi:hypothetical protein
MLVNQRAPCTLLENIWGTQAFIHRSPLSTQSICTKLIVVSQNFCRSSVYVNCNYFLFHPASLHRRQSGCTHSELTGVPQPSVGCRSVKTEWAAKYVWSARYVSIHKANLCLCLINMPWRCIDGLNTSLIRREWLALSRVVLGLDVAHRRPLNFMGMTSVQSSLHFVWPHFVARVRLAVAVDTSISLRKFRSVLLVRAVVPSVTGCFHFIFRLDASVSKQLTGNDKWGRHLADSSIVALHPFYAVINEGSAELGGACAHRKAVAPAS